MREASRSFMGLGATLRKCSGPNQKEEGTYKCEACPMSFGTQRGLSTHERHAHPAVRNVKRRGADPEDTIKWTADKVTFLKELWEVYKDHRHPNKEISKILTNKTIDQIKYQRRKLKSASEDDSPQEVTQVTERGCDPVDSGNVYLEESGVDGNNNESIEEWRLQMENAIMTPTEVPPCFKGGSWSVDKYLGRL